MYKLTQEGRWVVISPRPSERVKALLEQELSYEKKGAKFMPNPQWAWVRLYQPVRCRFPIGLLQRVCRLFTENSIPFQTSKKLSQRQYIKINSQKLRPYQHQAIAALIKNKGGIISLPTGAGKTILACEYIRGMKCTTLVVVPTIEIKKQWLEQVPENTQVHTYQSLKSKSFITQFDLIVFDECHTVAAKSLQLIGLNADARTIIVGLSATPMMRDDDNLKVESVLGPIVFEVRLRSLIDQGYLSDATVYYHDLPKYENAYIDYNQTYNDYIVDNTERNDIVVRLGIDAANNGSFVLVLVDKIAHGELLEQFFIDCGAHARFIHGSSKNREDNDYQILIATSIYDMGVDIPRLDTLILAGGGKSTIKNKQRIGRVLRIHGNKDGAVVHDFIDRAKWLFEHYESRRAIFEKDFAVKEV